jgi:hypothetical protein
MEKYSVRSMELHIDGEHTFQSVQNEFTALYPFLKIDFFRTSEGQGRPLPRMERILPQERIRRFVRDTHPITVGIGGHRTVAEVVKGFEERLILSVMILRKSGNMWIGTTLTLDWTLERQNREGEHISRIQ